MNIAAAVAPHAHRIALTKVWGGFRASVDGTVVCNRGSRAEAEDFAQRALYASLVQAQQAQQQAAMMQMLSTMQAMMQMMGVR